MHILNDTEIISLCHETSQGAIDPNSQHFQVGQLPGTQHHPRQTFCADLPFCTFRFTCYVQNKLSPMRGNQTIRHVIPSRFSLQRRFTLSSSVRDDLSLLIPIQKLGFKISQLYKFRKNAGYTLGGRRIIDIKYYFRIIWLLIGIIDAGKILDLSFVYKLVETLDIALATHLDGALDVYLDKILYLPARPFTRLTIRSNGSRDTHNAITCEQAGYKCYALDVGIPVLATKPKPLA